MEDEVKERPILFSGPMVRAILEGRKTQTRRVVKFSKPYASHDSWGAAYPHPNGGFIFTDKPVSEAMLQRMAICREGKVCPYGRPGDRLWVRETWRFLGTDMNRLGRTHITQDGVIEYKTDGVRDFIERPFQDIEKLMNGTTKGRPSIHMPRWASRIDLGIKAVRVERLQEISEKDAKAEGVERNTPGVEDGEWIHYGRGLDDFPAFSARESFQSLWDSINAKRGHGWDTNPWVWVVEFQRVRT